MKAVHFVLVALALLLVAATASQSRTNRLLKAWVRHSQKEEVTLKRRLNAAKIAKKKCYKPRKNLRKDVNGLLNQIRLFIKLKALIQKKVQKRHDKTKSKLISIIDELIKHLKNKAGEIREHSKSSRRRCMRNARKLIRTRQKQYDAGAKGRHAALSYYKSVVRSLKRERRQRGNCKRRVVYKYRVSKKCRNHHKRHYRDQKKYKRKGGNLLNYTKSSFASRSQLKTLKHFMGKFGNRRYIRCYKASVNGRSVHVMHNLCNHKGRTLTIYKSKRYVFGGFQTAALTSSATYRTDPDSFIFTLTNPSDRALKLTQPGKVSSYAHSTYVNANYLPTFGGGHDLHCSSAFKCYTNLGYSYGKDQGMKYGTWGARKYFTGQYNNIPLDDVEVYYEAAPRPARSGIFANGILSAGEQNSLYRYLGKNLASRSWKLCYKKKGSKIHPSSLHYKCDGKGRTVTIYKVEGAVVAGYQTTSLSTVAGYRDDSHSFIMSLRSPSGRRRKFTQPGKYNNRYGVYSNSKYLPTFGGGHDMYCRTGMCYFNLGYSYGKHQGIVYSSNTARTILTGQYTNNYLQEVEVYTIVDKKENTHIFKNSFLSVKEQKTLSSYLPKKYRNGNWKRCYKASKNGRSVHSLHSLCNYKGRTLTIYKGEGYTFGGFQTTSLSHSAGYQYDSRAFIFTLTNPSRTPMKFSQPGSQSSKSHSIYNHPNYLPTFGGGHDIYCSSAFVCYTNLGYSYGKHQGVAYATSQARHLMTGHYNNIKLQDVEVYYWDGDKPAPKGPFKSSIMSAEEQKQLKQFLPKDVRGKQWKRCYSGDMKNGYSASALHKQCNHKSYTLTVYNIDGYVLGGMQKLPLTNAGRYYSDKQSFIFSLRNPADRPQKFTQPGYQSSYGHSIYSRSNYMPTFGGGHDLYCSNVGLCYTNFGYSYGKFQGIPNYGSIDVRNYLTGRYSNAKLVQVEVYYL